MIFTFCMTKTIVKFWGNKQTWLQYYYLMLWQLKFNIYLPSEKPYDITFIQGFQ